MFELNFRDERYLPFEGAGALSTWRIELPPDCNAFDLDTITDVVMRMSYTARNGGDAFRNEVRTSLALGGTRLRSDDTGTSSFQRLFSLKHEYAVEWQQFMSNPGVGMRFALAPERFPFPLRGRGAIKLHKIDIFLVPKRSEAGCPTQLAISAPGRGSDRGSIRLPALPPAGGDATWLPMAVDAARYGILPHATGTAIDRTGIPTGADHNNYTWTLNMNHAVTAQVESLANVADILLVCTVTA
jgi:hypothetical protein